MHYKSALLIFALLAIAQPASASQEDDVTFVAEQLLTVGSLEQTRASIAVIYAKVYEKHLIEKAVKIADREKFQALFPHSIAEKWIDSYKDRVQRCLHRAPPEKIEAAAGFIRNVGSMQQAAHQNINESRKDNATLDQALSVWISELENSVAVFKAPGFAETVQVSFCAGLGSSFTEEIKNDAEVRPGKDISLLVDILATPGVATFPNRIIKNDILSELRETAKYSQK